LNGNCIFFSLSIDTFFFFFSISDGGKKFQQILEAYETLSDMEKRDLYDKYGEEGVKTGGAPVPTFDGDDADDFFSGLFHQFLFQEFFRNRGFGNRSSYRSSSRRRRSYTPPRYSSSSRGYSGTNFGRDKQWTNHANVPKPPKKDRKGASIVRELLVTLEEMYLGCVKKVTYPVMLVCGTCNGCGTGRKCGTCHGTGKRNKKARPGRQKYQRDRAKCKRCGGKGHKKCQDCKGKGALRENRSIDVSVGRGMKTGHKFTFVGSSHQKNGTKPGDVIVILKEKKHKVFKRIGNDLHIVVAVEESVDGGMCVGHFLFGLNFLYSGCVSNTFGWTYNLFETCEDWISTMFATGRNAELF